MVDLGQVLKIRYATHMVQSLRTNKQAAFLKKMRLPQSSGRDTTIVISRNYHHLPSACRQLLSVTAYNIQYAIYNVQYIYNTIINDPLQQRAVRLIADSRK